MTLTYMIVNITVQQRPFEPVPRGFKDKAVEVAETVLMLFEKVPTEMVVQAQVVLLLHGPARQAIKLVRALRV